MKTHQIKPLLYFFTVLAIVSMACGISVNTGNDTPQSAQPIVITATPLPPTAPPPPTAVPPTTAPQPTAEASIPESSVPSGFQSQVDFYYEKGFLSSKEGEYIKLDDFSKDLALINYYDFEETGYFPDDFMVIADFKWKSAIQHPDPSGCAWAFRIQGGDFYFFLVDRDYVYLIGWDESQQNATLIGATSGNTYLGLGNPADVEVTLIVNGLNVYAFVDGYAKGSFYLDSDFLTSSGGLGYGLLSGTNKDYGTRCEMSNIQLWIMDD
ncbi:MAG: hypothetical protein JXA13_13515 [Anaerolineales bacterium]|nr:hypothetical protein [Anaerolineales bacterium]